MGVAWFVLGFAIFLGLAALGLRLARWRADAGDGGPMLGVRHPGSHPFLTSSERRVGDDDEERPASDDA